MQQANQPFHYSTRDGVEHFVAKGDVFADKDPVVKGREVLFDEVPNLDAPAHKPAARRAASK